MEPLRRVVGHQHVDVVLLDPVGDVAAARGGELERVYVQEPFVAVPRELEEGRVQPRDAEADSALRRCRREVARERARAQRDREVRGGGCARCHAESHAA